MKQLTLFDVARTVSATFTAHQRFEYDRRVPTGPQSELSVTRFTIVWPNSLKTCDTGLELGKQLRVPNCEHATGLLCCHVYVNEVAT